MRTEDFSIIKVGIADLKVAKGSDRLRTSGLGSCVGLVLYDSFKKTAGLAHIMLPLSALAKNGILNPAKYADTAVEDLLKQLKSAGVQINGLKAKIAGGAQMFLVHKENEMMRIGPRNVEAVKEMLLRYRIPLVAEDVGGSNGRTIEFDPVTGFLAVKTVNKGTKWI
ncbi:chemotaxis protein CheD [Metabacillus sp. RGM 3146]|uniref:chemotaxis protein CheD n=1 Tax=Metabacillus sp. RGM 3146 TaxID=3401092 RepID=UPI003B99174D